MVALNAGKVRFEVDAVIFDKDGTLIDLDVSWAAPGRAWIDAASGGDAPLWCELAAALGFDGEAGRLVPDGVMAAGTLDELDRHTRMVLVEVGLGEEAVDHRVDLARRVAIESALRVEGIPTLGDVAAGFRRLAAAGVLLGVVTSDDRAVAEALLVAIGVEHLVRRVVGGDDDIAPKPSPDGILAVCGDAGVDPARTLMVGDSTADLLAARNAGLAGFVAVGADSPAAAGADAVVASIDDLSIVSD
ncbi:MAG: HAD family hydrolase [Acidimicrobiia bacterium]